MSTRVRPSPLPAIFISHGTPMLALAEDEYTAALKQFAVSLPEKPKAIVVVSAHGTSETDLTEISVGNKCALNYDFGGFPGELYRLEYPCPGSPELSARIAALLSDAGLSTALSSTARLDHGVWIPLRVAFPEATIPVVQVSMPYPTEPQTILKMGKALSTLREEGVLLIGSGGIVHNLEHLVWHGKGNTAETWAVEFENWVKEKLVRKDVEGLLHFRDDAPHANLAHPTPEHFYPIFFTIGASLAGEQAFPIFEGFQYGSLSMLCFALKSPPGQNQIIH